MNDVAAAAVVFFSNEADVSVDGFSPVSAGCFAGFMAKVGGLWAEGFPLLHAGASTFDVLFEERMPTLAHAMGGAGFGPEQFKVMILASEWLTLFRQWLPFDYLKLAFERVMAGGLPAVIALTIAILEMNEDALLLTAAPGGSAFGELYQQLRSLWRSTVWTPPAPTLPTALALSQDPKVLLDGKIQRLVPLAAKLCSATQG